MQAVADIGRTDHRSADTYPEEHKRSFLSLNCSEMAVRQRGRNRRPMKTTSAPFQCAVPSGRNSFFS